MTWLLFKTLSGRLFNFIAENYRVVAFFLLLALTYYYKSSYDSVQRDYERYKANVATVALAQSEKNKQEIKTRENITNNVVQSYADTVEKLNDYYAKNPTTKYRTISMCPNTASGSGMPTKSESTQPIIREDNGTNQATTTRDTVEVQIDMQKISKEIVQLLELQEFERKQDSVQ